MRTFHDDYPQNIQHTWQLAVWLGVKCKKYKLGFQTDINILNMETRSNHYILVIILTFEKDVSGQYDNPLLFDLVFIQIHNTWPIDHLHNVKYSTYMRSAWWANQNIHVLYDHWPSSPRVNDGKNNIHTLWKYVLYMSHIKGTVQRDGSGQK